MKAKVIGLGAAGGKATINLIEKGVINRDEALIINTTLRDVPESYKDIAIVFSNSTGGAGKERAVAKKLCMQSISDDTLSCLDSFIDPDDKMVIIVNSLEGGTGCGSAPTIAKYMKEVIGVNVHMFGFTGFEEDGRGLQNTIEYYQEISDTYTVQSISNNKFLQGSNKIMAEKKANDEFVERIKILLGRGMIDSEQNIDETDLYKVSTTPGFMNIEKAILTERIKNVDNFNKILTDLVDESKSLESPELSAKRIAVILNLSEKSREFVDYTFSVLKERYGTPFEVFTHIQYDGNEEYISFIISGMNLPLEEVQNVYKRFQEMSNSVNTSKDNFLEKTREMSINSTFDMINVNPNNKVDEQVNKKKSFLSEFEAQWESQITGTTSTISVKPEDKKSQTEEQRKKKEAFLNDF